MKFNYYALKINHFFKIKLIILLVCLTCFINLKSSGQNAIVSGFVYDHHSGKALPGVNITLDKLSGTITGKNGEYTIQTILGEHTIKFSYIGYQSIKKNIHVNAGKNNLADIHLKPIAFELNPTVISASKYEQRLSDVTVSMEVIKPEFIEHQQASQLDEVLDLLPGVDVLDGQANIRGGSGYSFGTGSRVMMLLNGLPMLTGDASDVKWEFLPIENTGQAEVIKGASSSLYGSSALNGVINLRTAWPEISPVTELAIWGGMFMTPARRELSWWWDHNPYLGGLRFSYMKKAGKLDIVTGAAIYSDQGYREENHKSYGRANLGLRYHFDVLKGLNAGFFSSVQYQELSDFLIWIDADSGAYMQNPATITPTHGYRFNIDPFITLYDNHKGKHSLKTRFYSVDNRFDDNPDKNNASDIYYTEYHYNVSFLNELLLTAGISYNYTNGKAQLYGDHFGSSKAVFIQLNRKFFGLLSGSLGFRWEHHSIDNKDPDSRPVIRTGMNYQISDNIFLRASFGQAYRYPSVAEKYTATGLGSLNIFPNPELKPETGWSTELGIKRRIDLNNFDGFIDIAGFWSEYNEMMEFVFGVYKPDSVPYPTLDHVGFKSINIGKARINGAEVTLTGKGTTGKVNWQFLAGYTYMNPVDLSSDTSNHQILKYRYHHSAKGNITLNYNKFNAGVTIVYRSFMERIDEAFEEKILGQEILPRLKEYRQEHDKGAVIFDFSLGYQLFPSSTISFIIKNLFNKEYMGRPGDIRPPRNISLQYKLKIS